MQKSFWTWKYRSKVRTSSSRSVMSAPSPPRARARSVHAPHRFGMVWRCHDGCLQLGPHIAVIVTADAATATLLQMMPTCCVGQQMAMKSEG